MFPTLSQAAPCGARHSEAESTFAITPKNCQCSYLLGIVLGGPVFQSLVVNAARKVLNVSSADVVYRSLSL